MVEGTKVSADLYLLFMGWVSQIDLFQIWIMEMNNRFSLSHLCHIFMRFSVGNVKCSKSIRLVIMIRIRNLHLRFMTNQLLRLCKFLYSTRHLAYQNAVSKNAI